MEQQYVTLIAAAVGSGLTLVGVYFTNRAATKRYEVQLRHEQEQRREKLLRERGEELFMLASEWCNRIAISDLRLTWVMQGKITYNECLDLEIADGQAPHNFARITMLIHVYFPAARPYYDALVTENDNAQGIRSDFKREYEKVGDAVQSEKFLSAFVRSQFRVDELGAALEKQIIEGIRSIEKTGTEHHAITR